MDAPAVTEAVLARGAVASAASASAAVGALAYTWSSAVAVVADTSATSTDEASVTTKGSVPAEPEASASRSSFVHSAVPPEPVSRTYTSAAGSGADSVTPTTATSSATDARAVRTWRPLAFAGRSGTRAVRSSATRDARTVWPGAAWRPCAWPASGSAPTAVAPGDRTDKAMASGAINSAARGRDGCDRCDMKRIPQLVRRPGV